MQRGAVAALQPIVRAAFWKMAATLEPAVNTEAAFVAYAGGKRQLFRAKQELGEFTVFVSIIFQFEDSADENTLLVSEIVVNVL